jgi:hypothetical protein
MRRGLAVIGVGLGVVLLVGVSSWGRATTTALLIVALATILGGAVLVIKQASRPVTEPTTPPRPIGAPRHPGLRLAALVGSVSATLIVVGFLRGRAYGIVALLTLAVVIGELLHAHVRRARSRGVPRAAYWGVEHEVTFLARAACERTLGAVSTALESMTEMEPVGRGDDWVRARRPPRPRLGWGVDVSIDVSPHNDACVVRIHSASAIAWLLDGGESWSTLSRVESAVRAQLHAAGVLVADVDRSGVSR